MKKTNWKELVGKTVLVRYISRFWLFETPGHIREVNVIEVSPFGNKVLLDECRWPEWKPIRDVKLVRVYEPHIKYASGHLNYKVYSRFEK